MQIAQDSGRHNSSLKTCVLAEVPDMSPSRIQLVRQMEMGTGNVHHQSLGPTETWHTGHWLPRCRHSKIISQTKVIFIRLRFRSPASMLIWHSSAGCSSTEDFSKTAQSTNDSLHSLGISCWIGWRDFYTVLYTLVMITWEDDSGLPRVPGTGIQYEDNSWKNPTSKTVFFAWKRYVCNLEIPNRSAHLSETAVSEDSYFFSLPALWCRVE
jgi:hypothetical protein